MLQAVISRLGGNGFTIKGWAITVAAAFLGLGVNAHNYWLALMGVVPTVTFWLLDTFMLRTERLFRHLFNRIRILDPEYPPFYMSATEPAFVAVAPRVNSSLRLTAARPTLVWFYVPLLGAILVVGLLLSLADATPSGNSTASASPDASGPVASSVLPTSVVSASSAHSQP